MRQLKRRAGVISTLFMLFVGGVSAQPTSLKVCEGLPYGPCRIRLNGDTLYGVSEGFLIQLETTAYEARRPTSLADLTREQVSVTISSLHAPKTSLTGQLSVPDHHPPEGVFLWRPSKGLIPRGDYILTLTSSSTSRVYRASLTITAPESLTQGVASLGALKLQEVQHGLDMSCCRNREVVACRQGQLRELQALERPLTPREEQRIEEECRSICWVSAYTYAHRLTAPLQWSGSAALRSMLKVELVSTLGSEVSYLSERQPSCLKELKAGESLPDQVCAHLVFTHLLTGERLVTPEPCLQSSAFVSVPHTTLSLKDYTDYELDNWLLKCDTLTPTQIQLLTTAGKLKPGASGRP